jgi:hypothetical protein
MIVINKLLIPILLGLVACSNTSTKQDHEKPHDTSNSIDTNSGNKKTVVVCNNTRILINKSELRENKERNILYLPVTLDNKNNDVRNDIIFSQVGFFLGGGDNGLSMPFKPTFLRVKAKGFVKTELAFRMHKNPIQGFLKAGKTNNLKNIEVFIEYRCRSGKGMIEKKRKRY